MIQKPSEYIELEKELSDLAHKFFDMGRDEGKAASEATIRELQEINATQNSEYAKKCKESAKLRDELVRLRENSSTVVIGDSIPVLNVVTGILNERRRGYELHGNHRHSFAEWLLLARSYLDDAGSAWRESGEDAATMEAEKAAAMLVNALLQSNGEEETETEVDKFFQPNKGLRLP